MSDFWDSQENTVLWPDSDAEKDRAELLSAMAQTGLRGCLAFQTSGSEGLPKWTVISKDAFLASARAVNHHFQVQEQDVWLLAIPEHHVGGFSLYARSYLAGCRVAKAVGKWSVASFHEQCEREKATLTSLVPTQVFDLVRAQTPAPPSLRAVLVGGGRLEPELRQQAEALGWPVFETYGMTEAGSQIATEPYSVALPIFAGPEEPGVGRWLQVLPHWEVSLDPEGQLQIFGQSLASGYFVKDQESLWCWQPIQPPFLARDFVEIKRGSTSTWLRFLGRVKGVVKVLGELVHLAPLQARLEKLALEKGAQALPLLVPVSDARRGHRLVIVAESNDGGVLMTAYNEASPGIERAQGFHVMKRMPRSGLGKPLLQQIQAELEHR